MTSSARDIRYGRRGGRWANDVTVSDVVAELDKYRADKAAREAMAQLDGQLSMFGHPGDNPGDDGR